MLIVDIFSERLKPARSACMLYLPEANGSSNGSQPLLSVVIVIRDRADELKACLSSLEAQINPPPFEVVIIDDGSQVPVTAAWKNAASPGQIRVFRQIPNGIAAARNHGVEMSRGRWIMFTDSDCEVCPQALYEVGRALAETHGHIAFQLKLIGDRSNFVECMEEIRLVATQHATSKPDGHIHYLATGGFVIHGDYARFAQPLFDPELIRSEDSALLAQLTAEDNVPVLLKRAVVRHKPRLTTMQYARKHFWMGYRSIAARRALQKTGHTFITGRSRFDMVGVMYRHARAEKLPISAVAALLGCHMLNRIGRIVGRLSSREAGLAPASEPAHAPVGQASSAVETSVR